MIESPEEFVRLRESEDPQEYGRASWDAAAEETWLAVIERYPEYRFWVAQNKTVPLTVLGLLASDPDPRVRSMVARKGKLPVQLLLRLARDPEDGVRLTVAAHRRATPQVLALLVDDEWEEVRDTARARLGNMSVDPE
jgi:hypothetical protein